MGSLKTSAGAKAACRSLVVVAVLLLGSMAAHAKDYVASAKEHISQDQLRSAVIELKNALQANPKDPEARLLLGTTYLRAGDPVSADKELRRAAELGVARDRWLIPLAHALLWQNQADEVLERVTPEKGDSKALKLEIHVVRANVGLAKGDDDLLREELSKAQALDPNDAQVLLVEAHLARRNGNTEQAWQRLNRALQSDPRLVEAYLVKGRWLYLDKRFGEAISAYNEALKLNPHHPNARTAKAAAHLAANQLDAAEKELDAMGAGADRRVLNRYMRALLSLGRGHTSEAENQLREVLRSVPDFAPAHLLLGAVSYQQGQMETAESHLSRYLAIDPSNSKAAKLLSVVRLKRGDPSGALQVLEPRISIVKDDAQFLAILGTAYMKQGDFSKGSDYLTQAAALAPDAAAIRTQLGISELGAGDADRATAQLQAALQLDPDMLQADLLLVLVHIRQGQYDEAVKAAQEMAKRHPDNPLPYNMIGAAYMSKNAPEEARKYLRRALEIDPKFSTARLNLARLDLAAGDDAAAQKTLEQALAQDPGDLNVLIALAQLAERAGDKEQLRARLQEARSTNPDAIEPQLLLTRLHLSEGSPLKALSLARQLASEHPRDPVVLRNLGQAQLAASEKASAVVTFERLVGLQEKSEEAYYLLARAKMINDDLAGAARTVDKALELNPRHVASLMLRTTVAMKQNKPDRALATAQTVQRLYPDSGLGFQLEGGVELERGRYQAAEQALAKAYQRAPSADVAVSLYKAHKSMNDVPKALEALERWLKHSPDDARVRLLLASQYQAGGQNEQAIEQYELVREAQPGNVVAWNNLAWLYLEQGDSRALQYAERAYGLEPQRPEVLDTFGWILLQQGQARAGLEKLRAAASKAPHLPSIQYHVAVALERIGDAAGARNELQRILGSQRPFSERAEAEQMLKRLSE